MTRAMSAKSAFLLSVCSVCSVVTTTPAADWLNWRGPEQTGVSRDTNLPDKFGLDPSKPDANLIWKAPYGCRSTPLVMGGRVFIINNDGQGPTEGERVMALDAKTGKVQWEHKFNVFHADIVSSRVGWTNLAGDPETQSVYAHGVQGLLMCLDASSGKVKWEHSLTEEYGRVSGYGGRVVSPVLDGDLVIVGVANASWGDQARSSNRFVAFDKRSGAVVWWSTPVEAQTSATYYASAFVTTINGQRLLIAGTNVGELVALQVHTGKKVWGFQVAGKSLNTAPLVDGNLVYATQGEENPGDADAAGMRGRVVCLDAGTVVNGQPKLVWEHYGVRSGLASSLLHDGKLYVPDDGGMLYCFDAKTGKQLWRFKYGLVARGAPVWADGKIYIPEVNAKFHILKPEETRCRSLYTQFFPSKEGPGLVEVNGNPAVADGRIFFATRDEIYCIGKKDWKPAAHAESTAAHSGSFASPAGGGEPAQAQVIPGDIVLAPGASTTFKVRLFDKNGNLIKESAAEWSLPLPPKTPTGAQPPALQGEIKDGKLTVSKTLPGQQGYVDAKVGNLNAQARVRVAPQLPYTMDFEKVPAGGLPGGWVNAQGKFAVAEHQGGKVLKKLAENPLPALAKANTYLGMPELKDYDIQADVSATQVGENLPDMGICNQRYTLQLSGNKQELRILDWDALPRIDKTIPFQWKANEWYTLKLTVDRTGKTATIRGKVWPRGKPEPNAWTIEIEDHRPEPSGSPALYGYATGILGSRTGAEVYYDNVSVTPKK
jgi:outer membrane protein assembly factor BamB